MLWKAVATPPTRPAHAANAAALTLPLTHAALRRLQRTSQKASAYYCSAQTNPGFRANTRFTKLPMEHRGHIDLERLHCRRIDARPGDVEASLGGDAFDNEYTKAPFHSESTNASGASNIEKSAK